MDGLHDGETLTFLWNLFKSNGMNDLLGRIVIRLLSFHHRKNVYMILIIITRYLRRHLQYIIIFDHSSILVEVIDLHFLPHPPPTCSRCAPAPKYQDQSILFSFLFIHGKIQIVISRR